MVRTVRWLIFLVVLVGAVALTGARQLSVQAAQITADRGSLQIDGNIRLELALTPEIVQPGDSLELQITLVNQSQLTQIPEINVQLPASLSMRGTTLPGGMTINVAARQLNWLPVLVASGGRQEVTLPLRVETADIRQPEQPVTVTLRQNGAEINAETTVWIGAPPQIGSIIMPQQVAVGQPFALRAEAGGSGPFTHAWDLGDGRRLNINEPTIVYPSVGQYQITVTTSNPLADASRSRQITIVPHPAAQFTADDFTPSANQPVTFINQSGGQPPLRTVWEFGDGTGSEETNPTHQYTGPGVYQVRLQVSNDYGTSEAAWTVTVGVPPTTEFTLPETAAAGQSFTAQATGDPSITLYTWDMGDGQLHEGAQISHTYPHPGDYYVTLTASNEYGNVSLGGWVQVKGGFFATFLPFLFKSNNAPPDGLDDGLLAGITPQLPDVPLDEPFVMPPLDLPASLSPAEQLFAAINAARQHFELAPLTLAPPLSTAAQQHTNDMATFAYAGHLGSDGSTPAERLLRFGYPAGYAGEATAWGYNQPVQAVEFWVNSPSHRRIILNEFATDVGVGYTLDFSAPNVWYWTAEFGNAFAAPITPTLRLRSPQAGSEWLNTDVVRYAWNWPAPLADGQAFVVKLDVAGEEVTLGLVNQAHNGTYYALETDALTLTQAVGPANWWVELSDGRQPGAALPPQPITLIFDPTLPTPTPALTPTAVSPTPTITPTPTPTEAPPQSATRPPSTPLPPLVTATPNP